MNQTPKNNFQNIIWDWNGTLLNDITLCVKIANKILSNHSELRLDIDAYKNVFGFPITDYYQKIGIDANKEAFEILTQKFITDYTAGVKNCALHDYAPDTLEHFKTSGKKQFILTAAHKKSVIPLLAHYGITHYFAAVEGLDNHRAESKVDRGLQLMIAHQIHPPSTVLIGDTIHDFEVAQAMNIQCILIANGHQSKARLLADSHNTIPVLDTIQQLTNLLL